MKTIQTEGGYYQKDEFFVKKITAPDDADLSEWKFITEEEYNTIHQTADNESISILH